jgi:predicted GTPase
MHAASAALAAGADFLLLGPSRTMLPSQRPVVAICAARTGSGKSQTTRRVVEALRSAGKKVVVVRHPMPYGDLEAQRCQRFAGYEDLELHRVTIEEREEYEPHIERGTVVYAGIDYEQILERAEEEADIVVWDGGNNDLPFFRPDVHIVVVDPLRAGHERRYHPGEANVRMANVIVVNKVDSATDEQIEQIRSSVRELNPTAAVVEARSPVTISNGVELKGKRALVVEDGPTLTHGEMTYGAGVVAARNAGAELVDPRPFAVGTIAETYAAYPATGPVLPAMGYSAQQIEDLAATINGSDADVVVIATPVDLRRLARLEKPAVRVTYDLEEVGSPTIADVLAPVLG